MIKIGWYHKNFQPLVLFEARGFLYYTNYRARGEIQMEYKDTLNLPKTKFKMKANLAQEEPKLLKFWGEEKIYEKVCEEKKGLEKYILHDGPPYANGNIHIGTAYNKILKDIIPKYKSMKGYDARYVPGWDTHGLPIEFQVTKDMKVGLTEIDPVELRKKCTDYAKHYINV